MPDGTVTMEIGDVQGHDVDAAAFMGQVRLSMRAIAAQEPDPGTLLMRTNELLITMDPPRFASCTMLHLDPRDGQVTGTSAGHVPLLCAYKTAATASTSCRRASPGSRARRRVPRGDLHLDKDSALIMVTDGVVEGPGLTLEAGLERAGTVAGAALHEGLNAEETADRILDARSRSHLDDVACWSSNAHDSARILTQPLYRPQAMISQLTTACSTTSRSTNTPRFPRSRPPPLDGRATPERLTRWSLGGCSTLGQRSVPKCVLYAPVDVTH